MTKGVDDVVNLMQKRDIDFKGVEGALQKALRNADVANKGKDKNHINPNDMLRNQLTDSQATNIVKLAKESSDEYVKAFGFRMEKALRKLSKESPQLSRS